MGPFGSSPRGDWEPVTPLEGAVPSADSVGSWPTPSSRGPDPGTGIVVSQPLKAVEDEVELELESAAIAELGLDVSNHMLGEERTPAGGQAAEEV